jgi:hypothetical protein
MNSHRDTLVPNVDDTRAADRRAFLHLDIRTFAKVEDDRMADMHFTMNTPHEAEKSSSCFGALWVVHRLVSCMRHFILSASFIVE